MSLAKVYLASLPDDLSSEPARTKADILARAMGYMFPDMPRTAHQPAAVSPARVAEIRAHVASQRSAPVVVTSAHAKPASIAGTPGAWRAEWDASAALQSEFPDPNGYVALRKAETAGRVKVISKTSEAPRAGTPDTWRAEWGSSSELQAEFASVDSYVALRKAEAAGRVKLCG